MNKITILFILSVLVLCISCVVFHYSQQSYNLNYDFCISELESCLIEYFILSENISFDDSYDYVMNANISDQIKEVSNG